MAGDLDGDDSDEKQPPSRWLEAARYALAMVVTVLIVAVIVHAIKVLVRPDSLSLTVVRGSVFSDNVSSTDGTVHLNFNLRAFNPTGRSRMYFVGITAYLFDKDTPPSTSNPKEDCIAEIAGITDKAVMQLQSIDANVQSEITADTISTNLYYIYTTLLNGSTIAGVTMRVDGSLITEFMTHNTSAHPTTYYCPQLLLGGDSDDEAFKNRQDVPCARGGAGPAA